MGVLCSNLRFVVGNGCDDGECSRCPRARTFVVLALEMTAGRTRGDEMVGGSGVGVERPARLVKAVRQVVKGNETGETRGEDAYSWIDENAKDRDQEAGEKSRRQGEFLETALSGCRARQGWWQIVDDVSAQPPHLCRPSHPHRPGTSSPHQR